MGQSLTENNRFPEIQFGSFRSNYQEWHYPRFLTEKQFREQVDIESKVLLSKKETLSPKDYAEKREALPFNLAFRFMSKRYAAYDVKYSFDNDKVYLSRKLLSYTTDTTPHRPLSSNMYLSFFDARNNNEQSYAWNGKIFRRITSNQDKTSYIASVSNTNDPSIEMPPVRIDAPPLDSPLIRDKIESINEVSIDGENIYRVKFTIEKRSYTIDYDKRSKHMKKTTQRTAEGGNILQYEQNVSFVQHDHFWLPRVVEYIESLQLKGETSPHVVLRRQWILQEMDTSSRPDPFQFSPPIPKYAQLILFYNNLGGLDIALGNVPAIKVEGLFEQIIREHPSNKEALIKIVTDWKKRNSSSDFFRRHSAKKYLLLVATILLCIAGLVLLWKRRRQRNISPEA